MQKVKVNGHLVQTLEWNLTDIQMGGRTEATASPPVLTWLVTRQSLSTIINLPTRCLRQQRDGVSNPTENSCIFFLTPHTIAVKLCSNTIVQFLTEGVGWSLNSMEAVSSWHSHDILMDTPDMRNFLIAYAMRKLLTWNLGLTELDLYNGLFVCVNGQWQTSFLFHQRTQNANCAAIH